MYVIKPQGAVYHVLDDRDAERTICGQPVARYLTMPVREGKPSPYVFVAKPPRLNLCRHCEKTRGEVWGRV